MYLKASVEIYQTQYNKKKLYIAAISYYLGGGGAGGDDCTCSGQIYFYLISVGSADGELTAKEASCTQIFKIPLSSL